MSIHRQTPAQKPDWATPVSRGVLNPIKNTKNTSLADSKATQSRDPQIPDWAKPVAMGVVHPLGHTTDLPIVEPAGAAALGKDGTPPPPPTVPPNTPVKRVVRIQILGRDGTPPPPPTVPPNTPSGRAVGIQSLGRDETPPPPPTVPPNTPSGRSAGVTELGKAGTPPPPPIVPPNTPIKRAIGMGSLGRDDTPPPPPTVPPNTPSTKSRTIHFSDKVEIIPSEILRTEPYPATPLPCMDSILELGPKPAPKPAPKPEPHFPPPTVWNSLPKGGGGGETTPPPPSPPPSSPSSDQLDSNSLQKGGGGGEPTPPPPSPPPNTPSSDQLGLYSLQKGGGGGEPTPPPPSPPAKTPSSDQLGPKPAPKPEPHFPPPTQWNSLQKGGGGGEATPPPPSPPPSTTSSDQLGPKPAPKPEPHFPPPTQWNSLPKGGGGGEPTPPPPSPPPSTPSSDQLSPKKVHTPSRTRHFRTNSWRRNSQVSLSMRGGALTGNYGSSAAEFARPSAGPSSRASRSLRSGSEDADLKEIEYMIRTFTQSYKVLVMHGAIENAWARGEKIMKYDEFGPDGKPLSNSIFAYSPPENPNIRSLADIKPADLQRWVNSPKIPGQRIGSFKNSRPTVKYLADSGEEVEVPTSFVRFAADEKTSAAPPWRELLLDRLPTASSPDASDLERDGDMYAATVYCLKVIRGLETYDGVDKYIKVLSYLSQTSTERLWLLKCSDIATRELEGLKSNAKRAKRLAELEDMIHSLRIDGLQEILREMAAMIKEYAEKPSPKEKSKQDMLKAMQAMRSGVVEHMRDGPEKEDMLEDIDLRIARIEAGDLSAVFPALDPQSEQVSSPQPRSKIEVLKEPHLEDLPQRVEAMNTCLSVFHPSTPYNERDFLVARSMLFNMPPNDMATFVRRLRGNLGGEQGPQASEAFPESAPGGEMTEEREERLMHIVADIAEKYLELKRREADAGTGVRPRSDAERMDEAMGLRGGGGGEYCSDGEGGNEDDEDESWEKEILMDEESSQKEQQSQDAEEEPADKKEAKKGTLTASEDAHRGASVDPSPREKAVVVATIDAAHKCTDLSAILDAIKELEKKMEAAIQFVVDLEGYEKAGGCTHPNEEPTSEMQPCCCCSAGAQAAALLAHQPAASRPAPHSSPRHIIAAIHDPPHRHTAACLRPFSAVIPPAFYPARTAQLLSTLSRTELSGNLYQLERTLYHAGLLSQPPLNSLDVVVLARRTAELEGRFNCAKLWSWRRLVDEQGGREKEMSRDGRIVVDEGPASESYFYTLRGGGDGASTDIWERRVERDIPGIGKPVRPDVPLPRDAPWVGEWPERGERRYGMGKARAVEDWLDDEDEGSGGCEVCERCKVGDEECWAARF